MKLRYHLHQQRASLLLAAFLGCAAAHADSPAGTTAKTASSPAVAPTNVVVEIPHSIFIVSSVTQAVSDPFYPNSIRLNAVTTTKTNQTATAADLMLKALFGTAARPMATINNATFGVGEEGEVITSGGKVRVRCLEIRLKDETAVVEVGGVQRELRFSRRK